MAEPRWTTLLRRLEHRATPIIALLLIGLVFFLGVRSERTGFVEEVLDPNLKRITHPVLNAFRGRPPAVTRLTIEMGEAERDSLTAMQDNALTDGWIDMQDDAWLPAQATVGDLKASASVRLLAGPVARDLVPRWPLIVGLEYADTTVGMRFFDLKPVNDAQPIHGAVFRRALEDLGIPVMTNEVVELRLNDRDLGLYTLEGKADSTRLAYWGRGNGPVLRFDDVLQKHALRSTSGLSFPIDAPVRAEWLSAPIVASRIQRVRTVSAMDAANRKAVEALERFRSGKTKASEVFDAGSLGKFLALCDVMGAQETAHWWNLCFLADTVTGKFIVLPQRTIAGSPITGIIARHTDAPLTFPSTSNSLTGRFLGDRVIYTAYIEWLDKLSDVTWLDGLMERNAEELERLARLVRSEHPEAVMDKAILEHCRSVVHLMLRPREPVLAYNRSVQKEQRSLAVANVHDLPILLLGYVSGKDTIAFGDPMVIPPRELDKPIVYMKVDLEVAEDQGQSVTLLVALLGSPQRHYVPTRTTGMFVANH